MRYKSLAYAISFCGFCLLGLHMFLAQHVLPFHKPTIGGAFRTTADCQKQAEALLLALHVAPQLHKDWSFGLAQASTYIKAQCEIFEIPGIT